jgi:hypothetical protein
VFLQSRRIDEGLSAVTAHVSLDSLVRPDVTLQVALKLERLKNKTIKFMDTFKSRKPPMTFGIFYELFIGRSFSRTGYDSILKVHILY